MCWIGYQRADVFADAGVPGGRGADAGDKRQECAGDLGIGQQTGLQDLRLRHAMLRPGRLQIGVVANRQQRNLRNCQPGLQRHSLVVQTVQAVAERRRVGSGRSAGAAQLAKAKVAASQAIATDPHGWHNRLEHRAKTTPHALTLAPEPWQNLSATFAIDKLTIASDALWDHPGEEKAVRILLIEDDLETAEYVVEGLQSEGHELEVSMDGRAALLRAASETWDLLIVDRMLPGLDGLAVVRTLRASGIITPALFLTTMGGLDDRVSGLNAGGDDYLVKPFAFAELVARVAALGRRSHRVAPETRVAGRRSGNGPADPRGPPRRSAGGTAAAGI